jgi:hypothetical protein
MATGWVFWLFFILMSTFGKIRSGQSWVSSWEGAGLWSKASLSSLGFLGLSSNSQSQTMNGILRTASWPELTPCRELPFLQLQQGWGWEVVPYKQGTEKTQMQGDANQ